MYDWQQLVMMMMMMMWIMMQTQEFLRGIFNIAGSLQLYEFCGIIRLGAGLQMLLVITLCASYLWRSVL